MHSKFVTSLVVLTALALASSPALAATAREDVSSSSSAKTPSRHSPHRKGTRKKAGAIVASHDKRHLAEASLRPVHSHPAEPTKTPSVAASVAEPMVVRTDARSGSHGDSRKNEKSGHAGSARPETKLSPAIDRGAGPKPSRVVMHGKEKEVREISDSDTPKEPEADAKSAKDATKSAKLESKPDTRPDEHGERRVLSRTAAAESPAAPVAPIARRDVPEHAAAGKPEKAGKPGKGEKVAVKPPCLHEVVSFERGSEADKFALSQCDGAPAPLAVEHLSVFVRPESAPRPVAPFASLAKAKGPELAPGVRKIDVGLVERLQQIVDHFGNKGEPARIAVISGYRPTSTGSYHATGQALDMRLEGVSNDALVAFCKTLPDTGCGYYPNSSFVHVDVRAPSTGHVYWIDTSGPGESPRYVASWPPPPEPPVLNDAREASAKVVSKLDRELPALPVDAHPGEPADDAPAAAMGTPIEEEK